MRTRLWPAASPRTALQAWRPCHPFRTHDPELRGADAEDGEPAIDLRTRHLRRQRAGDGGELSLEVIFQPRHLRQGEAGRSAIDSTALT